MVEPDGLLLVEPDPGTMEVEVGEVALGPRMALVGGQIVPFGGLHLVDPYALSGVAQVPQVVLRLRVALVGGMAVPLYRRDLVLRHADAVAAHVSESALCGGIPRLGGGFDQRDGAGVVLFDPVPLVEPPAELVHRVGVTALDADFEFVLAEFLQGLHQIGTWNSTGPYKELDGGNRHRSETSIAPSTASRMYHLFLGEHTDT